MIKDEELMRLLCRAAAMTKRSSQTNDTSPVEAPTHRIRGYGHILSSLVILTSGGKGISQQELADNVGIRPQSLSEAIASLEERGFIERKPDEADKRKMLVLITEAGVEQSKRLTEERIARAQKLFSVLDNDDKEVLMKLLNKLTNQDAQP